MILEVIYWILNLMTGFWKYTFEFWKPLCRHCKTLVSFGTCYQNLEVGIWISEVCSWILEEIYFSLKVSGGNKKLDSGDLWLDYRSIYGFSRSEAGFCQYSLGFGDF